jgi:exonuclease SbcD
VPDGNVVLPDGKGAEPRAREALLLHVSDCHLGGTTSGADRTAFARVIDLALEHDVDALLVAGDMFDSPFVPAEAVEWTAAQLDRLRCDVVVLPGNHDALLPGSAYETYDLEESCRSVQVITEADGETVFVADGRVAVWGRPTIDHTPQFRPLGAVPPRPAECFGVVLAHGLVIDGEVNTALRSSPIFGSDLHGLDWDYVALGHAAGYRVIQEEPPVVYAGNTAARLNHRGGGALVRLSRTAVQVERMPLAGRAGDGDQFAVR